jgi:putative transcriptional regulator
MIKVKISDMLGKHKMTRAQLSKETNIRSTTISKYYHETVRHIDVEHLNKFCKIFNCQVGDLLEYTEDNLENLQEGVHRRITKFIDNKD